MDYSITDYLLLDVVIWARDGKEFPDKRQNEREIKFIRVGDAVRIAGQPAQGRTDLEQVSLVYFYSQGTSNGIGVLWVIC